MVAFCKRESVLSASYLTPPKSAFEQFTEKRENSRRMASISARKVLKNSVQCIALS
ncbi:hypothetical protein KIN20_027728 [Parelaphostrongylus tenuis]|uniref:Uncharacterized protein n=1 Tax=Parelaphostrongylus tenuis TaxID=148309 RepID=A0AAD5QZQ8_PARTN|nr:hypothetical protein KIN20_027728 [Parelaphostrongylus tenuis]